MKHCKHLKQRDLNSMNENEEDECPELVPIDLVGNADHKIPGNPDQRVPVTIVTGFLGKKDISFTNFVFWRSVIVNIPRGQTVGHNLFLNLITIKLGG